jgi:hypothetical protein
MDPPVLVSIVHGGASALAQSAVLTDDVVMKTLHFYVKRICGRSSLIRRA